eukprot:scaffold123692_cov42-Cyclotella_meneghiniana.AAC.1
MVDEIGRISPTTGSYTFPLQPQLCRDPTSTFVTLPLASLPPLLPILLRHQQHPRTRILNKFILCLTPQHPMTIGWQEKGRVLWPSLLVFIPQRDWERSKA